MHKKFDIIIVGAGVVGSTLALALAKKTSLSIAILEAQPHSPTWSPNDYHYRVSAITLSSQRIFQSLDIWDSIRSKRVSAFTKIKVWDASNPAEICFDSNDIAEPVLGYIVENNAIQSTLEEKIKTHPQINYVAPVHLTKVIENSQNIELLTETETYTGNLVIAADGANSWLRTQCHIPINKQDYEQTAIVATVRTELPHEKVARQVFLQSGPLAFLPLNKPNLTSIVWSLPLEESRRLLTLDMDSFKQELAQAFQYRLGAILSVENRFSFPLSKLQAKQYIKPRIALVGDAAHTVHPLAGQGVNMGLLDAASLVEVICHAQRKYRDYASYRTLRAYERWRRADNANLMVGIDIIKKLFANNYSPVTRLRGYGLTMTNHLHWIKNTLTKHAVGNRNGLPELAD